MAEQILSSARFKGTAMKVLSSTPTHIVLGYVAHPRFPPVEFHCRPPASLRATTAGGYLVIEAVGPAEHG